jgi:hypothetical protein
VFNQTRPFSINYVPPKQRIVGNQNRGSQVITGVLVHQRRVGQFDNCAARFAKLAIECSWVRMRQPKGSPTSPFGREPALNPRALQYMPQLEGHEPDFFNTTDGSGEVARTGFPYAFFPRRTPKRLLGFPVVFEVRCQA